MADYDNCTVEILDNGRPIITHNNSEYKDNGVDGTLFISNDYEDDYYDYNRFWPIIAHNIYKYMTAMHISNKEMSDYLGFDFSYEEFISKKTLYSKSQMIKIAQAIGADVDKMLFNQELIDDRRWG